jgi:hypothetical protein
MPVKSVGSYARTWADCNHSTRLAIVRPEALAGETIWLVSLELARRNPIGISIKVGSVRCVSGTFIACCKSVGRSSKKDPSRKNNHGLVAQHGLHPPFDWLKTIVFGRWKKRVFDPAGSLKE